ncbi:transposase [Edaphobacter paludis]|uniref:Transposase n=1 Tax=Edaphobacter paludis TaxID=3035702 RepID=A0AAU7D4R9_9BACT
MEAPGVLVRQVRKRRSTAEKRLIVEQALEPGASVARVARAHGLNANVVFNWRRLYSEGKLTVETAHAMKLLPVSIEEREVVESRPEEAVTPSCGSIHIELPGDVRISVEGNADPAAIRAVLEALRA